MILRSFSLRSKYNKYATKSFVIIGPNMKFYLDSENIIIIIIIIYIALFTCADQKRFTVISLKTIEVYIIIHKQLKPKR